MEEVVTGSVSHRPPERRDTTRRSLYHFVMTKSPEGADSGESVARCRWCRRVLPKRDGRGRPKQFCAQKCRQWDWVTRQRAAELDLSENELVIARDQLDALHDELYVLSCAVEDAKRDLAAPGKRSAKELREMIDWLIEASDQLQQRNLL